MERINDTLRRLSSNVDFQQRYEKIRNEIMNHSEIRDFFQEHQKEITKEMVEKSLMRLYEYSNQSKECTRCPSLDGCINIMKGYHPELVIARDRIDIHYDRCPRKVIHDEKKKKEKLIKSLYIPKEIVEASFADVYVDSSGRVDAIEQATAFVDHYGKEQKQKGLYFFGKFGVGKSFLLGAIANELAKKKVSSMIIYFPELLRELKSSIADSTLSEKIERIKREPVLMLDDIGAETMTSWTRDEVLGPILQFRMNENLPTFFTSNFDYDGLLHHLTYSQRGEEEVMKARRIMERIKQLTIPVLVDGPNRRS